MRAYHRLPATVRDWIELPIIIYKAFKLRAMRSKVSKDYFIAEPLWGRKDLPGKLVYWILTY